MQKGKLILLGTAAIIGTVAMGQKSEAATMYRAYNPNSGEHFYTKNTYEMNNLVSKGWRYEGIGWEAPDSGAPVYRMYNPNVGDHHYTINSGERDNLKRHGWRYEGIGWYSDSEKRIPLYRAYNPNSRTGTHNYTVNTNEQKKLLSVGWRNEGVGWYGTSATVNTHYQPPKTTYLLNAPNYDQYALGAPSGCEGAALLQALQTKKIALNYTLRSFLNTIPKSPNGNPNYGFVGSPFIENAWTYSAIYPTPLVEWGRQFGNVVNLSGSSMNTLVNEVKNGNPVVAWVTIGFKPVNWGNWPFGKAANNNHAVTLDGVNTSTNQVHVSDSIYGKYWMSKTTFENVYNARKFAAVVR